MTKSEIQSARLCERTRASGSNWQSAIGNWQSKLRALTKHPELLILMGVLMILNMPGLAGTWLHWLIFQPQLVASGQWWRLLTHPFVHVTWYHFLLDGLAFVILYGSLMETKMLRRLAYVAAAGAGSLLLSWVSFPHYSSGTLCGLSGIAHGLMAVSALELMAINRPSSSEYRVALVSLILVLAKALFEGLTGRMFFGFLEFGLLGQPVAVSHAGGICGAVVAFLFSRKSSADALRNAPQEATLTGFANDPQRSRAINRAHLRGTPYQGDLSWRFVAGSGTDRADSREFRRGDGREEGAV